MTSTLTRFTAVALLAFASPIAIHAQDAKPVATQPSSAAQAKLADALLPSLVRVEYTLQYDKGEAPTAAGWSTKCASCGEYHGNDVSSVVEEDRPFETSGFLISPDTVITADPMIHPRFVKKIAVSFGGGNARVDATPAGYAKQHNAMSLKLAGPLAGATPLKFDPAKPGPYSAITYAQENGDWTVAVQGVGGAVSSTGDGRRFMPAASPAVVVTADGSPVALSMDGDLPLDDSWKQSPDQWATSPAADYAKLLDAVKNAANKSLVRVTLNLRSPKAKPANRMMMGMSNDGDDASVRHVTGVLLDDGKTVLVLAELKSSVTARLERIRVKQADGPAVEAKFAHTFMDYGAFVATLDKPLAGSAVKTFDGDVRSQRDALLPAVQVLVQGEKRTEYFGHRRISGFNTGFRKQLYPALGGDEGANLFLFNEAGELVALPVSRRQSVSAQNEYQPDNAQTLLTPVAYLRGVMAGLPKTADAGNVPLSVDQENRLAWLGVELQALNAELARVNAVSDLTSDGTTGALVTHVYPDSPAAKAGVEPGWILIRAHVAGEPKPLEVKVEQFAFADQPFPWDRYDEFPEQFFDQMPAPWPPAENTLTRALTDLGFGRSFEAEFFHDGKVERKPFTVDQSPAHYDSSTKYKYDPLGVTVRELTYEVSRYFQITEKDPGVIISKIEMGSKASTAGLKPYELITHVNEKPVKTAKEFEQVTKGQTDLNLSVRRMAKTRQVKVKLAATPAGPTTTKAAEATPSKED